MAPKARGTAVALSLAFRRGAAVVVQVHLPDGDPPGPQAALVLRSAGSELAAPVEVRGAARGCLAVATFEGAGLRPGSAAKAWKVLLRDGERAVALTTFLFVPVDGPVALLWGSPHGTPARPAPRLRQLGAAGGRVADRALAVLPPERALQVRGVLRDLGRRVLK